MEQAIDSHKFAQASHERANSVYVKYSTKKSLSPGAYSHHYTLPSSSSATSACKKKKNEKAGKGLRHFSMKVCQKVKEKGVTTYNEVADELVQEEGETNPANGGNFDQKNIRRRVYDALNVLMAMNIISKEKKEIKWLGLPTSSQQECEDIEMENSEIKKRIDDKERQLKELLLKHVSFKSLTERNKDLEKRGIVPSPSSAVQLPFLVINTNKKTHINCSISNDKRDYVLKFDDKFEVHSDDKILQRMGLLFGLDKGECSEADVEKLKKIVPESFRKYIEIYGIGYDNANAENHNGNGNATREWVDSIDDSSYNDSSYYTTECYIKTESDIDDIISEDGGV